MEAIVKDVYSSFNAELGYAVDEVSLVFARDLYAKACQIAKTDSRLQMDYLRCLVVTEYPEYFQVVALVYSTTLKHKFAIKVNAPKDDAVVPSVTGVWSGANWHEREGAELFGVIFKGHPEPGFLLLFDEFKGKYPMRKDYPYEEITEWSPETHKMWEAQP